MEPYKLMVWAMWLVFGGTIAFSFLVVIYICFEDFWKKLFGRVFSKENKDADKGGR